MNIEYQAQRKYNIRSLLKCKTKNMDKSEKRLRFARGRAKRKMFSKKSCIVTLDDNNLVVDCSGNNNYKAAQKMKKVAKSAKILSSNNKRKRVQRRKEGLHEIEHARALRGALGVHLSALRPKDLYDLFRITLKQPSAATIASSCASSSSSSPPSTPNKDGGGGGCDQSSIRALLLKRTPYKFCSTLSLRMQRLLLANLFVNSALLSLAKRVLKKLPEK